MSKQSGAGVFTRWLVLPTVLAMVLPTAGVLAQDEGAMAEVVVTGSRIRQNPLDQKDPVLIITADDMRQSGFASLGDYLNQLSISGSALNTRFNSSGNFGFPPDGGGIGAGSTQIDLRHLGCKRVLVLVNGVRWVNGASASGVSSCVDLNTIPLGVIARIEVLENGASPLYGSDAISGVVNIITKTDVNGINISAYTGEFDEGDGVTQEYSITMGTTNEESSSWISLNYYKQSRVKASTRSLAQFPKPFAGGARHGSSGTPQGRFFLTDPNTGVFINCTTVPGSGTIIYDPLDPCGVNGLNPAQSFDPWDNGDRFNFSQFNLVVTPSERWNIFGQSTRQISPNVNATLMGSFTHRESTNQAAPEPWFIGSEAGNGNLMDTISIDVTNPFNPFGFTIDANDPAGYFIGRRPLEVGPRIFDQSVDTWYLSGRVDGEFTVGDREVYWDIGAAWSKNSASQLKQGAANSAKLKQALGPLADCTAPCVPLNIFGGQGANGQGTITQDMLDFVTFVQHDVSDQELTDITLNVSSTIADLPAGPLGFAAGYEHREEDGSFNPDPIVVAGESAGIPSLPTSGGFDVDEFYLELNVPILADVSAAEDLSVSLAVRSSDYSTFGSETTASYGVYWKVVPDFVVRYNFSEGFRAPGIGELFGSASRFDATIADPCSDFNNTGVSQTVIDNCVLQGVPASGSYVQLGDQISVSTGGNRDLNPETSDTWTLGFVYSPSWVDNVGWIEALTAEVTYYDIELTSAIGAIDAQTQLEVCALTNDPALCGAISRTGNGTINAFANQLTNIGGIDTNGYDVNLTYLGPEGDLGTFGVTWHNSFVREFDLSNVSSTGGVTSRDRLAAEENNSGIPKWKSTLGINWLKGNWNATWTLRHVSGLTESCSDFLDGSPDSLTNQGVCSIPDLANNSNSLNYLEATTYNDVQVMWRPDFGDSNDLAITFGVQNLFDEDPPACFSCSLNGYDPSTYDAQGVFGYFQVALSFD
ncbi:MAG: TonB-dependent receptor [Proteobacteria bacterium]|nr:TonB-dependent receptor [Pseudomonadota bacterium]